MYNLLIVDDEIATCRFLERFIGEKIDDINVVAAMKNGEEAVGFLKNNNVDIILSDIRMPKMDGIELAKYVHENKPDIKVILMSAYNEFSYAQEAFRYNVFYYLLKAIDTDELKDVITRVKKVLKAQSLSRKDDIFEVRERFIDDVISGNFDINKYQGNLGGRLLVASDINDINFGIYTIKFDDFEKCLRDKANYGFDSFKVSISRIIEYTTEYTWVFYIEKKMEELLLITGTDRKINRINDIFTERCSNELSQVLCQNVYIEFVLECKLAELACKLREPKRIETINEEVRSNSLGRDKEKIIREALLYMNQNYDKDISRDDIAKQVFLSGAYFGRIFKNYFGISVNEYLLRIRMNKAIELLTSNEKIVNIYSQLGYNNDRHFRRVFYMYTGYSPSEYRKKVLRKDFDLYEND
ncbi:MAG: response regulator [Clostridia bacterium]|nr:response regulator [Clostridia bacterium]